MNDWNVGLMKHLGMRLVEVGPERVVAELEVSDSLTTVGGAVHGGTLMALADTAGAAGTASALHKGKRTHVWQTRVTDGSGRLLSLTTQTQMILDK